MDKVRFRDVAGFVCRQWRQEPWLVTGALATMLAATLCDVFIPVAAGDLIDALTLPAGDGGRWTAAFWALAFFLGLSAAFYGLREICYRFWIPLAARVMRRLVSRAFTRVQRFAADWHANSFSGATVRKISRGMWAYDDFADVVFFGFLPAGVVLVGVAANLFLRWPLMGAFVVAAVALYCALSVALTLGYVAPANRRMNRADSELGAAMADAITCNTVVKGYGAERREERRFGEVSRTWADLARHAWTREINVSALQSLLTLALQAGLLGLALWLWSEGRASAGDVAFVVTSYFLINGYLREIGTHVRTIQQAVNELDDLVRFDRQALDVVDLAGAQPLVPGSGEIRFEAVTFGYRGQAAPLYAGFSLTIAAGERIALVGPSGSGKSSFVKLVQRLYDIQGGRILIDGQDIAQATQESVRRAIALVPQDPALFHRSLAENIAYARPEASQRRDPKKRRGKRPGRTTSSSTV